MAFEKCLFLCWILWKCWEMALCENIHWLNATFQGNYYNSFVCVDILRPSQPNGVMSRAVSLPNHIFSGQALSSKWLTSTVYILLPDTDNCMSWISWRERMTLESPQKNVANPVGVEPTIYWSPVGCASEPLTLVIKTVLCNMYTYPSR